MLNKFVKPRPHAAVLRMTHPLNNLFFLFGVPVFNKLPLVNKLPFLGRGVCHIKAVRYLDESALQARTFPDGIHFIGPNHPEFFTDWMLDKHVVGTHHLRMANWAAHTVVNGMGSFMQKFWLANNLIAQIPSSGNKEGKAYAVDQALQGYPVLMHPEGMVHWTANHLSPIFDGIADLAIQAHQRAQAGGLLKPVYIHTPTWKLVIVDESPESATQKLNREIDALMQYGEQGSPVMTYRLSVFPHADLGSKLDLLHQVLLINALRTRTHIDVHAAPTPNRLSRSLADSARVSVVVAQNERYPQLLSKALHAIWQEMHQIAGVAAYPQDEFGQDWTKLTISEWRARFKRYMTALKAQEAVLSKEQLKACQKRQQLVHELIKFDPKNYATGRLTVEEVAECLQRLRTSFCNRSLRDKIHQYVPAPLMGRHCYVNWDAPLDVSACMAAYAKQHGGAVMPVAALTAKVFERMQQSLAKTVQAAYADDKSLTTSLTIPNPWSTE